MKILLVRQNYPPERGAVRYVSDLAENLASRGHEVTVITGLPHYPTGRPYPGFGRFRPDMRIESGVKVIRLPLVMASNHQPLLRIVGFLSFAAIGFPILLCIQRPDVLVTSVPPVTVGLIGPLAARLRGLPLVLLLHDYEPLRSFELRGLDRTGAGRLLIRFFTRIYRMAERMVVTIETERQALIARGAPYEKIEIITHGVDVDRFEQKSREPIPFELFRRPGRRLALYLGTLGVAHDVESLIRAFSTAEVKSLPVDLAIVGDGECEPVCREIIEREELKGIRIYSPVSLDWVPALLSSADLLVLSQKPDLFSLGSKFYEYCATGKPMIANSSGILARTIRKVDCGWVFEARVPGSLEEALGKFLRSSGSGLSGMGARAKAYARDRLSITDRHDRWEKLLGEVINAHGG
ncbi:MAG: glycosyltransferase family 4 protein, partial [Candidatus Glassbacteria bacterium]